MDGVQAALMELRIEGHPKASNEAGSKGIRTEAESYLTASSVEVSIG